MLPDAPPEAAEPQVTDASSSQSTGQDVPTFFVSGSPFSIYQEMCRVLLTRGWKSEKRPQRMTQCRAILGDRFDIPYHILRTCQVSPGRPKLLVNYFKGSHKLTLKAPMGELLSKYEPESTQWMPQTFSLCSEPKRGVRDERSALHSVFHTSGPIWIVKPSSGCHGNGMLVSSSYDEVCHFVDASPKTLFVVQRYVDRPLLVLGRRKFDIRVWALLVHPYSIYIFSEASCRTSSMPYSTDHLDDQLVHITNHCMQEGHAGYGDFEEGNEIMFTDLDQHLLLEHHQTKVGGSGSHQEEKPTSILRHQMEHIVRKTLGCIQEEIEVPEEDPFQCFQLFGYDFLVDETLKVYLLEVNGSPGAAQRLLTPLVEGMTNIVFGLQQEEGDNSSVTPRWYQLA